jgi:hypothetical protein
MNFIDAISYFGKGREIVFYYYASNVTDNEDRDAPLLHKNGKQLEKLQNHFGKHLKITS